MTRKININVAKDQRTGDCYCPYCKTPRTILLLVGRYRKENKCKYMYQCTSCEKIVWGYLED